SYLPAERVVLPLPPSIAGLTKLPQNGNWLISVGFGPSLYQLVDSDFLRYGARRFVDLDTSVGGLAHVPRGPWEGHLLFADWSDGEVRRLVTDAATGLPLDAETGLPTSGTANPIVEPFLGGLGRGPWGLEFDPRTSDLLVTTWTHGEDDRLLIIDGTPFGRAAPIVEDVALSTLGTAPVTFELVGNDADTPVLRYILLDEPEFGRFDGSAPELTYVPEVEVLFREEEVVRYVATDGTYTSAPGTITIDVFPSVECGGCAQGMPGAPVWLVAVGLLVRRRSVTDR
ncbi:MAG: hypothetical protein AAF602_12615, partial [Myxococcota bacterium]